MLFAGPTPSTAARLQPTGAIAVLGVRFHPHGAAGILPIPQHELAGAPIGFDADLSAARTRPEVRGRFGCRRAAGRGVQCSRCWLGGWIDREWTRACRFAVQTIQRSRGQVSIDRLADAAGLTRRHLERRFLSAVGVSPKRLARMARFQHALRVLDGDFAAERRRHRARMRLRRPVALHS